MRTDDFFFELPDELIAQHPTDRRGDSRLLVLDRASGRIEHSSVARIVDHIEPGSLMVFNDSRVRKARLFGTALDTGARVEFLLLRRISTSDWEAVATKLKKQKQGRRYAFPESVRGEALGLDSPKTSPLPDTLVIRFDPPIDDAYLERSGHVPLPPYIKREDDSDDDERYQNIYSSEIGSAACPTAGLHFSEALLAELDSMGVERHMITLHVGLGTFLPVRTEEVEGHRMHEESYSVSEKTARAITLAKAEGRPIIAVGTTSLRTLESAWDGNGGLRPGSSSTRIFIYPGYRFKIVDMLFTNFHTPRSTLLMLVSAFASRESILGAYAEAMRERYRFFSYGDAMLIR